MTNGDDIMSNFYNVYISIKNTYTIATKTIRREMLMRLLQMGLNNKFNI